MHEILMELSSNGTEIKSIGVKDERKMIKKLAIAIRKWSN